MRLPGPLLAVLCALALAGGCHSSQRPVSDEIARSYLRYWDAWLAASQTSDPDHPLLPEHVASPQLDVLRANLAAARRRNQVARGTVGHRLQGIEVHGGSSRVADCIDLDGWLLYDAETGERLRQLVDKPSQLALFALRQRDGRWRVTDSRVVGEC
jgi:hypothetical protein